jgi:hypothetical protein
MLYYAFTSTGNKTVNKEESDKWREIEKINKAQAEKHLSKYKKYKDTCCSTNNAKKKGD